jgi:hypothetical protein
MRSPLVSLNSTLRTNIQAIALCLSAFVVKKTLCSFVLSFEPFVVKLFLLGFRFIAKLSVLRLEGAPSEDSVLEFFMRASRACICGFAALREN